MYFEILHFFFVIVFLIYEIVFLFNFTNVIDKYKKKQKQNELYLELEICFRTFNKNDYIQLYLQVKYIRRYNYLKFHDIL